METLQPQQFPSRSRRNDHKPRFIVNSYDSFGLLVVLYDITVEFYTDASFDPTLNQQVQLSSSSITFMRLRPTVQVPES